MVPASLSLRKKLQSALAKLRKTTVDASNLSPNADLAGDLIEMDAFVAGIGASLISRTAVTASVLQVLERPFLVKNQLNRPDGRTCDLGNQQELRTYATRIEAVRRLCVALLASM